MKSGFYFVVGMVLAFPSYTAVYAETLSSSEPSFAPVLVAQATEAMADGEVRKIDKDAKKITLKHGEIKNLGMPPMTMVFQVKDPAMLDMVKQGDKVRFHAEQVGSATVVTHIETVK